MKKFRKKLIFSQFLYRVIQKSLIRHQFFCITFKDSCVVSRSKLVCYFNWTCLLSCCIVPAIPPPNVMWYNISSTSLKSKWLPVPPHLCNGIVVGYRIYIWKLSDDPTTAVNETVTASEHIKLFENLEKWTIYCGQVTAFTSIGEGQRSQVECIRTFEDGNIQ